MEKKRYKGFDYTARDPKPEPKPEPKAEIEAVKLPKRTRK